MSFLAKDRRVKPTEHQVQAAYFDLVRMKFGRTFKLIYAVPNGINIRSYATRAKYWREGRVSGVPDVNIDIPRGGYHGMRIEFKRDEKTKLDPEQEIAFEQLEKLGYFCRRHWDAETAWKETLRYLDMDDDARVSA